MISTPQCTLALFAAALALGQNQTPSGVLLNSRAIAFNPANGKVYAVDESQDAVTVIDTARNVSARIKTGASPDALAINTTTGYVYVANSAGGTVTVLNGQTNAVSATLKAGPHPYSLAVNEATNKVYVTNTFSNLVGVIDGAANTSRLLKTGSADSVAVDLRTNRAFLLGYENGNITILNGATETVGKLAAHEHLWGMANNQMTGDIYITGAGRADLLAVDSKSNHVTEIKVGAIPCAVAVNSTTNMIYVANYGDDTVTAVDGKRKLAVAVIQTGSRPQAIAVDSKTNRIYVANTHSDSVTVIDGESNKAIATVSAGKNPFAITTTSNPATVYVANIGDPSFTAVEVGAR